MTFKIYDCDFGFKMGGVEYVFTDVTEITIEDPERNKLTRGANGENKIGLSYKEGTREPKRWTVGIMNMSIAIKTALDNAYDKQTRLDVFAVARSDGSSKWAKNAVLSNRAQQLSLTDSPDSLNVSLEFETFESIETMKTWLRCAS